MKYKLVPLLLTVLAASCVAVRYESPRFTDEARAHREVAVLPFQMILVGKLPARLTPADVAFIEEQESLAFQNAFYYALLDRSDVRKKRRIRVRIQPVETTNRILAENGIGIRESWSLPADVAAEMLGVDAVVRTTVEKARYLSDAASFGIDVGSHVFNEATEGKLAWLTPPGLRKTHDIFADASLLDGTDGDLLWKIAVHRATDWHRPANDVIVGLTRKLAKKIPYRG